MSGARVEVVPTDGVLLDPETFLAAIDDTTLIVPISHVAFRSSYRKDVAAIVRRAHEVGAPSSSSMSAATG